MFPLPAFKKHLLLISKVTFKKINLSQKNKSPWPTDQCLSLRYSDILKFSIQKPPEIPIFGFDIFKFSGGAPPLLGPLVLPLFENVFTKPPDKIGGILKFSIKVPGQPTNAYH